MKPTMYFALLILIIYMIISLPLLFLVWVFGGINVFENFTKFGNRVIFNHD